MTQVIVSSRILEMDNEMASSESFTGRLREANPPSACRHTGGPISSCEMILLRKKRYGENIRVCIGIYIYDCYLEVKIQSNSR